MRGLPVLAGLLLAAGLALFAYAASRGEAGAGLVVIFPVIVGAGPWAFLGGLLIMGGLLAAVAAFSTRARERSMPEDHSGTPGLPWDANPPRAGGFILVGPIPIAFGTTRGLALAMLLLALLVAVALWILPHVFGGAS